MRVGEVFEGFFSQVENLEVGSYVECIESFYCYKKGKTYEIILYQNRVMCIIGEDGIHRSGFGGKWKVVGTPVPKGFAGWMRKLEDGKL